MITVRPSHWMNTTEVVAAVEEASISPLRNCGLLVEREAKKSMKNGGRLGAANGKAKPARAGAYYNNDVKQWVIASKPGTPPHAQTRMLRDSIRTARTSRGTVVVGPMKTAWYGRLHEFGLGKDGKVKRPFMRPALYRSINEFPRQFEKLQLGNTRAGNALRRLARYFWNRLNRSRKRTR